MANDKVTYITEETSENKMGGKYLDNFFHEIL